MREIGTSSMWVEKYRPKWLEDYICDSDVRNFAQRIIDLKEVPCLLLEGIQGSGKTSLAYIIANELDMDTLYINGSVTGIDAIRFDVQQFAKTNSLHGGKKLVILDEIERMSAGQLALKTIIEETEKNARYILCTNDVNQVIEPLQSRSQIMKFSKTADVDTIKLVFKRLQFILKNEGKEFDKKVLAEITQQYFPDIRRTINIVQQAVTMFDCVDERISSISDEAMVDNLLVELKSKKFTNIRKLIPELDFNSFYKTMYDKIDDYLVDECKPDIIDLLAEWQAKAGTSFDKELPCVNCALQIAKIAKWK